MRSQFVRKDAKMRSIFEILCNMQNSVQYLINGIKKEQRRNIIRIRSIMTFSKYYRKRRYDKKTVLLYYANFCVKLL